MNSQIKQKALEDAIKLAGIAFGTSTQSIAPFTHDELCAEFIETLYHKLCELYADAVGL